MKHNKIIKIVISIICISLILCGCGYYLDDYYVASATVNTMLKDSETVDVEIKKDSIYFIPDKIKAGFIFYPGGKVDHKSYTPLLKQLAENNILCILVSMPFHLAVFDIDAAKDYYDDSIAPWYIGGHSLGGSMASSYLNNTNNKYDGLILLASYSTVDFSNTELKVLSIYGSNDGVLNIEKYEKYKSNLPADFKEIKIDGANHANFASYGKQKNDLDATISNTKQIQITCDSIKSFIFER